MKILFVAPYLSGFSGVISDTLAGSLSKNGHELVLVGYLPPKAQKGFAEEQNRLKEKKINFYPINGLSFSIPGFVTEFPYFLSFDQVLEKVNPDLVHINCLPFMTSYQAALKAKKKCKNSILQIHGVTGGRGRLFGLFQELYNFTYGRCTFENVAKVLCLTEGDAIKILKYGCPSQKISIIPNGVDINEYQPTAVKESENILWCGRFIQQKGLEYLIDAFKKVKDDPKYSSLKLKMTGDGPLFPKIVQIVRENGLSDSVEFLGRVPRNEIPLLMNSALIYALPSLYEGMPYALLESMACGKPVIGSNIWGIKDIITDGQNGLLVPPRDSQSLANAIIRLLEDAPLRKKIGKNARALMVSTYSWPAVTKKVETLYNEIINR